MYIGFKVTLAVIQLIKYFSSEQFQLKGLLYHLIFFQYNNINNTAANNQVVKIKIKLFTKCTILSFSFVVFHLQPK